VELKLFYNGHVNRYLVSKFIRRFIIPLDALQLELCEHNNRTGERLHRRGRVVNDVINTGTGPGSAIVPFSEMPDAMPCLARRVGSAGFSSFVFGTQYPVTDAGYLTLIIKTAELPKHDGFYLNAFWGKPVPVQEAFLIADYTERKQAVEYWKEHGYSALAVPLRAETILFRESLNLMQKDVVERALRRGIGYVGRADLDLTWHEIWLKPDGEYYVYRGVR